MINTHIRIDDDTGKFALLHFVNICIYFSIYLYVFYLSNKITCSLLLLKLAPYNTILENIVTLKYCFVGKDKYTQKIVSFPIATI